MAVNINDVLMWLKIDGVGHALASSGPATWHYTLCRQLTPEGDLAIAPPTIICAECRRSLRHAALVAGRHPPKRKAHNPRQANGTHFNFLRENVRYAGDDCLIWPFGGTWNGYGHLGYDGKMWKAHRLMCTLAHGEPPTPKHVAAHTCNNGQGGCVNPRHLQWKTPRENLLDRRAAGTLTKKRWNKNGTLTDEQVAEICSLKGTMNQREIAAKFGISYQHVSIIQQGKLARQKTGRVA